MTMRFLSTALISLAVPAMTMPSMGMVSPESSTEWPTVSIMIPTNGRPEFLPRALAGIQAQDFPLENIKEVIVVDDSPRSGLRYRARRYRFALRVVRLSTPTSIGGKRNAGLRIARGAVVLRDSRAGRDVAAAEDRPRGIGRAVTAAAVEEPAGVARGVAGETAA